MSLGVDVDASSVRVAFGALRRRLDDMSAAWGRIGAEMRDAAVVVTPVASGALVASLTAEPGPDEVTFGSDLIYAGVQDRGWPAHNIAGHHFMDRAEDELRDRAAVEELAPEIQNMIDSVGLG